MKFENLEDGTYYVGETDAYGNLVGTEKDEKLATDLFYVQYLHNSKEESEIVLKTKSGILDADPETISINNQYFKLPKGFVDSDIPGDNGVERRQRTADEQQFHFLCGYLYKKFQRQISVYW